MKKKKIKKKKVKKPKKKIRIRWKKVLLLFIVLVIILLLFKLLSIFKITNIYVKGNNLMSDHEVINQTTLKNYPSIISIIVNDPLKDLKKQELIKKTKIKLNFSKVTIEVIENRPLFFNSQKNVTILENGLETTNHYQVPTLVNYVPDTIYDDYVKKMGLITSEILGRISEIKYAPDTVDESRFLLTMSDGNYVYLTLTRFDKINSYVNVIKEFPGKKGILYLNAGNSFEVLEK